MTPISIESPYAADPLKMIPYAHECCLDALARGESPYASHLFFTQFLNDTDPDARALGLHASDSWRKLCGHLVFYLDHGWSNGMQHALDLAKTHSLRIEFRMLRGTIDYDFIRSLGIPIDNDIPIIIAEHQEANAFSQDINLGGSSI